MPYFERIGDNLSIADHLNTLGYLHYALGEHEQARDYCERSQAAFEALGDLYGAGEASGDLGLALEALGRDDEAGVTYERAIRLAGETGNNRRIVEARLGLGRIEWFSGKHERAQQLFGQALTTNRMLDYHVGLVISLLHVAATQLDLGYLDSTGEQLREALDLSRQLNHLPGVLLGLTAYAALHAAAGNARDARGYLQSASALAQSEHVQLLPYEGRLRDFFQAHAEQGAEAVSEPSPAPQPPPAAPDQSAETASRENAAGRFGLTARELEVIALLVDGLSNQEIADQLFITRRTATTHIANIMNKVGLSSRTAVAALAVREGFA
jgi:DNA-binding NarL/FixJ family response regulator